jgi:hypothetical protein
MSPELSAFAYLRGHCRGCRAAAAPAVSRWSSSISVPPGLYSCLLGWLLRAFSQGGLGLVCITQPALGFFEYKLITVWNSCLRYHLLAKASSPMKERHTRLRCQWISHSTQDTHSTTVTSVGTKYPDATVLLFVVHSPFTLVLSRSSSALISEESGVSTGVPS